MKLGEMITLGFAIGSSSALVAFAFGLLKKIPRPRFRRRDTPKVAPIEEAIEHALQELGEHEASHQKGHKILYHPQARARRAAHVAARFLHNRGHDAPADLDRLVRERLK